MTAATITPSSTRCSAHADYAALVAERDRLRAAGPARRHRHRRLPRAERRQFDLRAAAQPQERRPRPGWNPAASTSMLSGAVTATIHTHLGRAGPRDAGRHRDRRGAGDRSRPHPRGARRTRCRSLPSQQPGRQPHGDHARRRRVPRRAKAQGPGSSPSPRTTSASRPERAAYGDGGVFDRAAPQSRRSWNELVTIAHRNFHRLPPGIEPGLAFSHSHAGADRRHSCRRRTAACRCIPASRSSSTSCWWRSIPISASPRSGATSSATTAAP